MPVGHVRSFLFRYCQTRLELHDRVDAEKHLSQLHYFLNNLLEFRREMTELYQLQIDSKSSDKIQGFRSSGIEDGLSDGSRLSPQMFWFL